MPNKALAGCYVISLRPVGDHGALRRAAAAAGARVLALSPWKRVYRNDADTREQLRNALACERVLFTSPAAVRAAQALHVLKANAQHRWFAVGSGTAILLRRAGIAGISSPQRMDSEGLLALPGLSDVQGTGVGLVTAPGGRNRIAPALLRRGARVVRADVYERLPVSPSPGAITRLCALRDPFWLAVSSGEALQRTLDALPIPAQARLRHARVAAASERLATRARASGFTEIHVAASARPRDLIAAMASASMAAPRPARTP
ncbi:MAG: uroporphyrinogen-III synthase [Xanthomonadaceae bacterium]|nr:uroporphyrinogen-III synthase [Xanthomonadaceae bacterium]